MLFSKKILFMAVFAAVLLMSHVSQANSMATGEFVVPPMGFVKFCVKNMDDCLYKGDANKKAIMSLKKFSAIEKVQSGINREIKPQTDLVSVGLKESWDYPQQRGGGDCEDYALAKKQALVALGFPKETLLLTTALTEEGEHHVVLTVATNFGDFILDNRRDEVVLWDRLPYRWLSRQDQENPLRWRAAGYHEQKVSGLYN
jgi:predicted transglutaminase-like cysteine proteinase